MILNQNENYNSTHQQDEVDGDWCGISPQLTIKPTEVIYSNSTEAGTFETTENISENDSIMIVDSSMNYSEGIITNVVDSTGNTTAPSNTTFLLTNEKTAVTNHLLTEIGNVQIDSTNQYFNEDSLYFDESQCYLKSEESNDFSFGSNDFTIECFYRPTAKVNDYPRFLQFGPAWANSNSIVILDRHNSYPTKFVIGLHSTNGVLVSSTDVVNGEWYHFAFVREGDILKMFINGILEDSTEFTGLINNETSSFMVIGGAGRDESGYINGNLSNIRITKSAIYTSNFDIPTTKFGEQSPTSNTTFQINVNDNLLENLSDRLIHKPLYEFNTSYSYDNVLYNTLNGDNGNKTITITEDLNNSLNLNENNVMEEIEEHSRYIKTDVTNIGTLPLNLTLIKIDTKKIGLNPELE